MYSDKKSIKNNVYCQFAQAGSARKSAAKTRSHTPPKPTPSSPPTTYADILDTLKLLEEAPPPLPGSKSKETSPTPQGSKFTSNYLSSANLGYLDKVGVAVGGAAPPTGTSLSESKLQSILSYLDEMEREDRKLGTQLSQGSAEKIAGGTVTIAGVSAPCGGDGLGNT